MSGISANTHSSDLDRWLANLGFTRGNPFATAEADQERALLPEFFVDVDGYERIKGDRSMIVFAPRGAGKSALRVVLSSHAMSGVLEATALAVEYSDFDELIARRHSGHEVTVDDYVPRLLRAGLKTLLELLCGHAASQLPGAEAAQSRQRWAARAAALIPPTRARMKQALRRYHPSLLDPMSLYERLYALDSAFAPNWNTFIAAISDRHLYDLIAGSPLVGDQIACLLADLSDYPDLPDDPGISPVERLASFVDLCRDIGMSAVYFLIDRLDEHVKTADDPRTQADILEPLLADLPVLELHGMAFKFFLSQEARDLLLERRTIRRDRLTDHAVTVRWDQHRLRQLLRLRLSVYSEGQISDLVQLSREVRVTSGRDQSSALLGAWIEDQLVQVAQESPRRLLVAAQLLCQAHVRRCGPVGLLERADWDIAKRELMHKMLLLLLLRMDTSMARVGNREIELTPLEHRILKALAQSPDLCDRDRLARTAWKAADGVSDQAVDKAIERLREKLDDDPDDPIYIRTERNQGFKLANYAIE